MKPQKPSLSPGPRDHETISPCRLRASMPWHAGDRSLPLTTWDVSRCSHRRRPNRVCLMSGKGGGGRHGEPETRGRPLEGSSPSVGDGLDFVGRRWHVSNKPATTQQSTLHSTQYDDLLTFRLVDGRRPGPSSPHPAIGDNLEMSRASLLLRGRSPIPSQCLYRYVGWLVDAGLGQTALSPTSNPAALTLDETGIKLKSSPCIPGEVWRTLQPETAPP